MKNNQNNKQWQVQVGADKTVIPAGKAGARIVEITLTAPPAGAERPHVPLNLSLVLDHSGSMHGDKLHFVKQAALHVVDLMNEQDRAALVVYDDKVDTLMGSQSLSPQVKNELKARIRGIQTGGSTFLYGGWLAGSRQVAEAVSDKSFNRTLLLTDGLANVGVRDIGTLSMHAQELFMRGISSSCFGVGQDYDEHLLEAMANLGGGNFHFLETLQAIPLVFEREFDEIIHVVMKDVQVTLTLPESAQAQVSANWHTKREGDRLTIFLGSLAAEGHKSLYLQLSNLGADSKKALKIPVTVKGMDVEQGEQTLQAALVFKAVPEQEEAVAQPDADLAARFAEVDLADKAKQALQHERAGDRVGASRVMRNSLFQHAPNISESTRGRYEHLTDQMIVGMDEADRKRRHYETYQSRRTQQAIRDYRLSFDGGVLTAEIDGLSVLLDSGARTSLGREPKWFFMDEVFALPQEKDGRTCQEISSALGTPVDVVLGMDILHALFVQVNPDQGVISFSRQPLRAHGWRLDLDDGAQGLTCQANIAGQDLPMRLRTAAGRSLVPQAAVGDQKPVGQAQVVLDGLPPFETALYQLPLALGSKTLPITCGVLPEGALAQQGVLGADVFQLLPSTLAFPAGRWVLLV